MNDKTLNVKVPKSLYDKLKSEANSKNISLAAMIRLICSEYFNEKEK